MWMDGRGRVEPRAGAPEGRTDQEKHRTSWVPRPRGGGGGGWAQ